MFERIYDEELLLEILKKIDKLFPIPLSEKCELNELSTKVISFGYAIAYKVDDDYAGIILYYANDLKTFCGYISVLAVKSKYRGMSIGKKLLEYAIKSIKELKMKEVFLYTHKTNLIAKKMYLNRGFKVCEDPKRPNDCLMVLNIEE